MVAASRTMICVAIALASAACGVVLPAAEDVEREGPGASDPVTTKGANMPAPSGVEGEAGAGAPGTAGTSDAGADGAAPAAPRVYSVFVTSLFWSADKIGGLAGADE